MRDGGKRRRRQRTASSRWAVCVAGFLAAILVVPLAMEPSAAAGAAPPPPPPTRCSSGPSGPSGHGTPLSETSSTPWDPVVPNERLPHQWLAKLATEGLGCAPDQSSFAAQGDYLRANGCSPATLRALALDVLTSRELLRRPYDDAERLLVLWRIARESEPDPAQLASQLDALRRHRARWDQVVGELLDPVVFGAIASRLCAGDLYGWDPARPVLDLPEPAFAAPARRGVVGDGSGADLQRALDAAAPGQTVWLARHAVIRVDAPVTIPSGVRLQTLGAPTPRAYAAMARLVRTRTTGGPMVVVAPGATLAGVWVDGQRSNQAVGIDHDSISLQVLGGTGPTSVRDDRIGNPAGWSNMVVAPGPGLTSSAPVVITGNLFTGYSTKFHYYETAATNDIAKNQFGFADGVSNSYGNSRIARNEMVDVTDVSFVMFRVAPNDRQRSLVSGNTIVNAGNSGWAAFTVDPLFPEPATFDFAGTTIVHNLVWTSPNASLLVIAGIGTQPWFGDAASGSGPVRFVANTSGNVRVNTQMAIAVSRMSDVVVRANSLLTRLTHLDACPLAYAGVEDAPGARLDVPYEQVVFQPFPAIPSVSHGCLVVHT